MVPAPVRTYRARRGRVTARQQRALDDLWAAHGVDPDGGPIDPAALFGRTAPLVLEVGPGTGEATVALAAADPGRDVLAVDVHTPGVGALLAALDERGLTNVRVLLGDVLDVLAQRLGPGSLDEVRVLFPDPWPKTRHHKRRLLRPDVVALVADRLRPGGLLHCATDWEPYAARMLEVLAAEPALEGAAVVPRPDRPVTRFERRGLAQGHVVTDVAARRR